MVTSMIIRLSLLTSNTDTIPSEGRSLGSCVIYTYELKSYESEYAIGMNPITAE